MGGGGDREEEDHIRGFEQICAKYNYVLSKIKLPRWPNTDRRPNHVQRPNNDQRLTADQTSEADQRLNDGQRPNEDGN